MSTAEHSTKVEVPSAPRVRVYGFVDGFNLYHALQDFRHANTLEERTQYQKYKWLCLWKLVNRFVNDRTEVLVGVEYFTSYPCWNEAKRLRHTTYVSALVRHRVHVTFGEFKRKTIICLGSCKETFTTFEEKQTDVNISTSLVDFADQDRFDKAIMVTEDSDQVPAVRLMKRLHPKKQVFTLPPIGRNSKELRACCDGQYRMDEIALAASQLPNLSRS